MQRIWALALTLAADVAMEALADPAKAQLEPRIVAPAAPGGGWDSTARAMQAALTARGAAKSVQVINIPGAGGTVGLGQW
jgi:putative tricarboxylic transport membrane protein